jgi:hypothetical protein
MLAALLTGVYSMTVQPTVTNVLTTSTEIGSSVSPINTEVTSAHAYSTSTESTIVGTVTTRLTLCSWPCRSGYAFFPGLVTIYLYETGEGGYYTIESTEILSNACIALSTGEGPAPDILPVRDYYAAVHTCGNVTSTISSYSTRILTLTSVNTNLSIYYSLVPFSVTLTEAYLKTLVNPEKLNLQRLAAVLFVIGFAGIALVIVLHAKLLPFPRKEISVRRQESYYYYNTAVRRRKIAL